jgi:hypothetical protein
MLQHPKLQHGERSDVAVVRETKLLAGVSLPVKLVGVEGGRRVIRLELDGGGPGRGRGYWRGSSGRVLYLAGETAHRHHN